MHFNNDIKPVGNGESSLHNVTLTAVWGWQPLSTFLPHIGNGFSRACYDLETNPAHVMKTSSCLVGQNVTGASNMLYLQVQQMPEVSVIKYTAINLKSLDFS